MVFILMVTFLLTGAASAALLRPYVPLTIIGQLV
jgi:hypothetical protein